MVHVLVGEDHLDGRLVVVGVLAEIFGKGRLAGHHLLVPHGLRRVGGDHFRQHLLRLLSAPQSVEMCEGGGEREREERDGRRRAGVQVRTWRMYVG